MSARVEKVAKCDPVWSALREQAEDWAVREPALASFVHATILKHDRLEDALSYHMQFAH
jgi:serine O-acetyltransferase